MRNYLMNNVLLIFKVQKVYKKIILVFPIFNRGIIKKTDLLLFIHQ
jgi:hypothetical protein